MVHEKPCPVRKVYLSSVLCFLGLFLLLPVIKAGSSPASLPLAMHAADHDLGEAASAEAFSNRLYDSLQLGNVGLSKQALLYACKGFQKLLRKGLVHNPDVLTVCDFSQSSDNKRMYILDLKNMRLVMHTYVAHGKNSGLVYARKFSNRMQSFASSLGFYITRNTYFGKHGLSLKLAGIEKGFNDNAEKRAVVVHGAPYIGDGRLNAAFMGRSFGCPAVPQYLASRVINTIKDGSCLFIYYPLKSYLHGSRILNG